MLRNLKAEILKNNLDIEVMARALGVKKDTFQRKLNEDISLSLQDCRTIKETFFPDLSLDYLFRASG